jgi:predicted metalloprotease with PDZ domain
VSPAGLGCRLLVLLALTWRPLLAAEPDPRIAEEIEDALIRLSEMGALQAPDTSKRLVIRREAQVRYQLGAVVGIEPGKDEMPVLAITPGGHAEQMGLQLGDRILAINGVQLAHSSDLGADFVLAVSRFKGRLELHVRRGERELNLRGRAEAIMVPGYRLVIEPPVDAP